MRRTTIINRMEDKRYPVMCSPEHEIELIIIAELLYMNMRGTSRVGGGAENEWTEEKTTGVSCVDLLLG